MPLAVAVGACLPQQQRISTLIILRQLNHADY